MYVLPMKWQLLDKPKLTTFIDSVKTSGEAALFNPVSSEGKLTPLPFYNNVLLYRLTSFASMPVFSLHFLSDGQRFFYLDGTITPLSTINAMGDLHLTASNVIAYLNFYFFAVIQDAGEMFLVQDPGEYPFQDQSNFDVTPGFAFGHGTPKYEISEESDGGFVVDTPLFMDGTMVRAQIRIDPNGRVHILSQRIMVGDAGTGLTSVALIYPD